MNEAPPSAAPTVGSAVGSAAQGSTAAPQPPAASHVLRSGELSYVDTIHNSKGPVRIVEVGSQRFVRFEDVTLTDAPDVHV